MKVLQVHNYYQFAGGEDIVLENEQSLLASYGNDVEQYTVYNDIIKGVWTRLKTAWQTPYSWNARQKFACKLAEFKPDVVHVHNFFPLLTPSIYEACQDADVPIVQTLHNYRIICPGSYLSREGRICEDCITGSAYQAALHGCYRGSFIGSLAVARMVEFHRKQRTWHHKVDRFIALTEFAKSKFIEAGFPSNKIVVKPNFLADSLISSKQNIEVEDKKGALFVGRLSQEKGIDTLLQAWKNMPYPLSFLGEGPLLNKVKSERGHAITCLGQQVATEVSKKMLQSTFLVMPSEWYEGFPMVLVEAFAHGLPVLASNLGSMKEIIEDGVTGLLFTPGNFNELAEKARWLFEHPEECTRMGKNARQVYLAKYTSEVNYNQLMEIYKQAMANK
jgi:glycosyltransferase involved in cell wall biosynthesis